MSPRADEPVRSSSQPWLVVAHWLDDAGTFHSQNFFFAAEGEARSCFARLHGHALGGKVRRRGVLLYHDNARGGRDELASWISDYDSTVKTTRELAPTTVRSLPTRGRARGTQGGLERLTVELPK